MLQPKLIVQSLYNRLTLHHRGASTEPEAKFADAQIYIVPCPSDCLVSPRGTYKVVSVFGKTADRTGEEVHYHLQFMYYSEEISEVSSGHLASNLCLGIFIPIESCAFKAE